MNDPKTHTSHEVNRFRELRSFYAIAWANWALTTSFLALLLGNTFATKTPDGPRKAIIAGFQPAVVGVVVAVLFAVAALAVSHRRASRRRDAAENEAASRATSERLRKRLSVWERFMCEVGGVPTKLFVRPDEASVMWTESSGTLGEGEPRVVLTTSFWTSLASDDARIRAAMAHEAGHVAAGDVELFRWLLSCERALAIVGCVGLALRLALYPMLADARPIPSLVFFVGQFAVAAVGVLAGWSALLKARELQADAFAVDALHGAAPMERFLTGQLVARGKELLPLRERLKRRVVEPSLPWRVTLPALRGDVGAAIELQLGLTIIATASIGWWTATFLGRYEALEGADPLFFAPVVVGVAVATYGFGWWRARSAVASDRPFVRVLTSSAFFLAPSIVVVPVSMTLLQIIRGASLAGAGVVRSIIATFVAGVIVCGVLGFLVALGVLGHAIDMLLRKPSPSTLASVVASIACVATALFGSFVVLLGGPSGSSNDVALLNAALMTTAAASSSPVLATLGHAIASRWKPIHAPSRALVSTKGE